MRCACSASEHETRLVVLTGGPGAGKTAALEVVRRELCEHVAVLPEAASIVYGGGFPRRSSLPARRAAQRAIFHVERELERCVVEERIAAIGMCDRGTFDGLAYWPGPEAELWSEVGADRDEELARYAAVIHLRTPTLELGYNHQNPLRTESAREAALIDARILAVWEGHPRRFVVDASGEFLDKVARVLQLIAGELPDCCRRLAPFGMKVA